MRSLNPWMLSSLSKLKLNSNLQKKNKKIKVVKSNRGGEYYGRYHGSGEQRPRPFALFLNECEIVPQYTILGKPSMNGVVERRNRTLKDMVRSMTSHSTFPESL